MSLEGAVREPPSNNQESVVPQNQRFARIRIHPLALWLSAMRVPERLRQPANSDSFNYLITYVPQFYC